MIEIFQSVLQLSAQGAILVVIALIARLAMRRSPANYRYLLWILVLARLLLPIQLPSPSSLYNLLPKSPQEWMAEAAPPVQTQLPDARNTAAVQVTQPPLANPPEAQGLLEAPALPSSPPTSQPQPGSISLGVQPTPFPWWTVAAWVWLIGASLMALGMTAIYIAAYRRVRRRAGEDGVAVARGFQRPFVIGLFRPLIALPRALEAHAAHYVLRHERAHIARLDHIARILMMAALCLHWFNPMAWVAARWMNRDCEAACDERATKGLSPLQRKQYAKALLDVAESATGPMLLPVLAFSGGGLKDRIRRVLSGRRATTISIVAGAVLLLTVAAGGLTAAWPREQAASGPSASPTHSAATETTAPPPATPRPSATPMPIRADGAFMPPLAWEGNVPAFPSDLPSWTYRQEPEDVLDIYAAAERLWGDAEYGVPEGDHYGTLLSLQPIKTANEQLYKDDDSLSYTRYYSYNVKPLDEDSAEYVRDIEETAFQWFGLESGSYRHNPQQDRRTESYAEYTWDQVLNDLTIMGPRLYVTYDSNGIGSADCRRLNLQPTGDTMPDDLLSLEEALYVVDYWRSRSDDPALNRHKELSLLNFQALTRMGELHSVSVVYSNTFSDDPTLYAPVWLLEFAQTEDDGGTWTYNMLVDPVSGDLHDENGTGYRSPYPDRPASALVAREEARAETFMKEYDALFPLVFARRDDYTYYLMPPNHASEDYRDRYVASLWRRDETNGTETLLDGQVAYTFSHNIDEIRINMFAALAGDRLVFRGYDGDLDYKSGGRLISIDLNGGDRRGQRAAYHTMENLHADDGRIYYTGWGGNDHDDYPLNYMDPLLEKDRNVFRGDKYPFAMRDGVAYAIDLNKAPSDAIYRWQGDGWSQHSTAPFVIEHVDYLLGLDSWLLKSSNGESMIFQP